MSLLIAKCGKPHTTGKSPLLPASKIILSEGFCNILGQSVPFTNKNVSRRINEMFADIEFTLPNLLEEGEFALQIGE